MFVLHLPIAFIRKAKNVVLLGETRETLFSSKVTKLLTNQIFSLKTWKKSNFRKIYINPCLVNCATSKAIILIVLKITNSISVDFD